MLITEVTPEILPLYLIETLRPIWEPRDDIDSFGCKPLPKLSWQTFTAEPFATREEALEHRRLMLKEYPSLPPERVRVADYTVKHWRDNLIDALVKNEDAVRCGLGELSSVVLRDLLRSASC